MTDTMRALVSGRGSEWELTELPVPQPDSGEVLIRNHAAATNNADLPIVNIGRLAGPASTIDLDALSYRHLTVHGVSFGFTRDQEMAGVIAGLLPEVIPAVAAGRIRPVIDRTYDIADFATAADRLRSGDPIGKLVLTFG